MKPSSCHTMASLVATLLMRSSILSCSNAHGSISKLQSCPAYRFHYNLSRSSICFASSDPAPKFLFVSIGLHSHLLPLLRIAREMKRLGHDVSVATNNNFQRIVQSAGVQFISAGAFLLDEEQLRIKLQRMLLESSNFDNILTIINDIYIPTSKPMFQSLAGHLRTSPPDLIVMDIATIGAQDLAHAFHIPYIINSPSIPFDIGSLPYYIPAWGTGFPLQMTLWQRCMNILYPRLLSVALTPAFMRINEVRANWNLPPFRSQHDVFKGARMLVNTAIGLEHAQPTSPLIDYVGPILPNKDALHLENIEEMKDIDQWLRSSAKMVIYIQLSWIFNIQSHQIKILMEALSSPIDGKDIRVLWAVQGDQLHTFITETPKNFKIVSMETISPLKILASAHVLFVVSHCGMASAQESLVNYKPLLCIPFLLDQPDVAYRVSDTGSGLIVDKSNFSTTALRDQMRSILNANSYHVSAKRVGNILLRAEGLNRAVRIITSSATVGFTHLKTADVSLPWHKVLMLDIWTVHIAVLSLSIYSAYYAWRFLYYIFRSLFNRFSRKQCQ